MKLLSCSGFGTAKNSPSVYAIQSQASSEECSGFFFFFLVFRILSPINPRKSAGYDWSRWGSVAWKENPIHVSERNAASVFLSVTELGCVQRPFSAMHQHQRRLLKPSFVFGAFYSWRARGATRWLRSVIRLSLGIHLQAWKLAQSVAPFDKSHSA